MLKSIRSPSVEERQEIVDLYYDFGESAIWFELRDAETEGTEGVKTLLLTGETKWHKSHKWCRV